MLSAHPWPRTAHRGVTLIEVLIALLIFSVGLLALVGLQTSSVAQSRISYARTQAVVLADDMADRMRANRAGVANGDYDGGGSTASAAGSQDTDCIGATGCDAAAMAGHDLFEWSQAITRLLPQATGVVCIDSTPADGTATAPACDGGTVASGPVGALSLHTIKIFWQEGGGERRFSTQVRIRR